MMQTYGITDRMILGDLYDLVVLEASHSVIITTIPFNFLVVIINFLNFPRKAILAYGKCRGDPRGTPQQLNL